MAMNNAEGNPYRTVILVGLGILVAIFLFTWWRYGGEGVLVVAQKFALWAFIAAIVFLIIYLIVWLFQTKRIDLVQIHKDRVVETCELNPTPYKQSLSFRAHGDDFATREVGKVIGCCMILAEPRMREVIKEDTGDVEYKALQAKYARMVFVAFKPKGIINMIMNKKEVVAGLPGTDFSVLTGETIWMNGMTFAPPLYLIYFLSHHWQDRAYIDETIKSSVYRYTLQENLKDTATIVEDAVDASPAHKKKQEMQNVQMVPINAIQPKQ